MNKIKTKDISNIQFTSTVFPTAEDQALWNSLSNEQRLAIIEREEEIAFQSGVAPHESKDEILARVRG